MVVTNEVLESTDAYKREKLIKSRDNLKKLLADTDYKAIKYAEGLISETEYTITKAQRQAWRDEINAIEGMLK